MALRPAPLLAALALFTTGCGGAAQNRRAPAPDYSRLSGSSMYADLAQLKRGWRTDFSRHSVPLSSFQRGGPGRDGIAAVEQPWIVPAGRVDFLPPEEPVLELVVRGEARAYPFGILLLHEIVNDRIAGVPVVVTFCPLCNTALAFDRRLAGRTLTFRVTGNLRNADLVMYDRQTESWWQQFGGEGLVGHYAGAKLRRLPSRSVLWRDFRREHPEGLVVTDRADRSFLYGKNPYLGALDPRTPAPFPALGGDDRRLPPSERVVLIERGGRALAVPFSALAGKGAVDVEVSGVRLHVRLNGRTADVRDERGRLIAFSEPFWFAAASFRPDVELVDG